MITLCFPGATVPNNPDKLLKILAEFGDFSLTNHSYIPWNTVASNVLQTRGAALSVPSLFSEWLKGGQAVCDPDGACELCDGQKLLLHMLSNPEPFWISPRGAVSVETLNGLNPASAQVQNPCDVQLSQRAHR